ncbi:MAG: ribosomal protein [Candidatus Levybacteria bacterium]|nr:ribosomal protein [Candidatus Levybacteria bacterium]
MAHIKRGMVSRRKHKKLLGLAKGYRQNRSRNVKQAKEAVLHAGSYAFQGRKNKKRTFRALWNIRISEAVKKEGLSYSVFMGMLKKGNVELDRKILSNLVVEDPETFKAIVAEVKKFTFA